MVPVVPLMEVKTIAENKTKSPELYRSPASKEEPNDVDMVTFLTSLQLASLLAHP